MWRKKSYREILQTAHSALVTASYLARKTGSVAKMEHTHTHTCAHTHEFKWELQLL